jgi:UDP-N-acetylglucosamine--N-acetylmuramyl-(pentapeptide) pyrophosphoryl-undecaprenol N-acetylglucosamine transferase
MTITGKNSSAGSSKQKAQNLPFRLMIAGAGTGGHLFPGIAVAQELMERVAGSRVMFVTTGKPIEKTVLSGQAFDIAEIQAAGLKGMGLVAKIRSLMLLIPGLWRSMIIMGRFRPDAVLGMGGYSAAPVMIAAFLRRVPRLIHEQNRLAGMTNQLLSRLAGRVLVSFKDTRIRCRADKIRVTGHPVRRQIRDAAEKRKGNKSKEKSSKPFTVVVLGGSQGAHRINTAVVEAFSIIKDPGRFSVIHQTGVNDEDQVRKAYTQMGLNAAVSAFFRDMASVYEAADVAICRAGAATLAEIAAVGIPSLLIPYPYAADNHQVFNAEVFVKAGAAKMILEHELTGSLLASYLESFPDNYHQSFQNASRAAAAIGNPRAAACVLAQIIDFARGGSGFLLSGKQEG